ncbi:c-type cytochrome [Ulvibacter litoralis]|uniref:Cytochrome c domain-containing protein n=1 Tax=Ulvibacter litoralis TaxID=227084 RepID=A0A1G7F3A2_9FLAO|nr:cytochrome c [Ulvibacter litoralis]GHC52835.1 hypothetical protein GCM10008083_15970 [Ulvibacter litoralis]SDE70394.1 hypothetical protein SAMN05421855_102304 [Ulvibacter litoralis]
MKPSFYLLFFLCISFTACTSSTYDDIEQQQEELPSFITYQDVRPIFEANCVTCHSSPPQNGAPMSLEIYSEVANAIETRGLLDRINREEGAGGLMPLGGPRMSQQSIDLIVQWDTEGLLEN